MEFDFNLPGLGRPKSSRPERVAEVIHQELSILLQQKVRDARLDGVCISKVQMSPDLKRAKVYYSLLEESSVASARKGLDRAKGFFRSHIAKTMNLRYTPDLIFYFDNQQKEIERLDQLFMQIHQEREEKDQGE
ncbi:MAG: 30S ribosome-binding factor RbfA [Candidatus Electrothrix sp. LOE1_4_5]|jgi:ribosome-binding factor A|nr:30S ribosome-binding factor RbfA [Candidatus Electrothrix sp. AX1]MCI5116713.1 30S ribosome-binding factor RbfA [Candidatus Electrothrix gigas]MCI5178361.1 30S ribosome-binding factor RbfA [Candidatus Electrothrix gigas]MCI5181957.1 30S ribosome-binding factor RbfA [Candidatus Electrothrix gigas]MCI5189265.1 30S ribosome-binding factor RbfA [Candidatus Electrothrix gigas]